MTSTRMNATIKKALAEAYAVGFENSADALHVWLPDHLDDGRLASLQEQLEAARRRGRIDAARQLATLAGALAPKKDPPR